MRTSPFINVIIGLAAVSFADAATGPFGLPIDKIRGVNLGGWLLAEKWQCGELYHNSGVEAEDEWNLQLQLQTQQGKTYAEQYMSHHWNSYLSENEIKELVGYGINFFRIPVGHWVVDSTIDSDEPWVGGGYRYLVRALGWIRDAGAFAQIDLHGAPGAQSNSQSTGHANYDHFWDGGVTGPNTQRALAWAANITTLASTKFRGTVVSVEAVNEPSLAATSYPAYLQAFHDKVRAVEKFHGITCSGNDPGDKAIKPSASKRSLSERPESEFSEERPARLVKRGASQGKHQKKNTASKKQTVLKSASVKAKKTKEAAKKKAKQTKGKSSKDAKTSSRYNNCLIIANMYNRKAVPSNKYANMANDVHQYQVFDDYSNSLDAAGHLQESCNFATKSEATNPSVIVGEWSLAVNNVDVTNDYITQLAANQIWAFEHGAGWIFWNYKGPGVAWNFLGDVRAGIIKTPLSSMASLANCTV